MQFNKKTISSTFPVLKTFLVILSLFSVAVFLKVLTLSSYPDFSVYYNGSAALLHGGNPYLKGFLYPPLALLFFLPFALLPLFIAGKIFTIFSLLCFFLSLLLLFKLFRISPFGLLGLFILILVFNFFPAKFTLGMGQINNVVLLLVTLCVYFYVKKKDYAAGVFLALAISLKLFPLLLILFFIIERRWKALSSTLGVVLVLTLATALLINSTANIYFLKVIVPSTLNSWKIDYYNQALSGFIIRDIPNTIARDVLRTVSSAILLIFSLFSILKSSRITKNSSLLSIGILITVSLIINSFSWQHHFVWLLIPFFVTLSYLKTNHLSWQYYMFLGVSFLLVAFNLKHPAAVPVLLQSHVLYGAFLLYGLGVYLLYQDAKRHD